MVTSVSVMSLAAAMTVPIWGTLVAYRRTPMPRTSDPAERIESA